MIGRRISLVTLPSRDRLFAAAVRQALEAYLETANGRPADPAEFETLLRRTFPVAVVRPRDELAEFSEHEPTVWYVQRAAPASNGSGAVRGTIDEPRDVRSTGAEASPGAAEAGRA